jgi:hypothetical protein
MRVRKIFYKVKLHLSNGQFMLITIATHDVNRIPDIVERHKVLYMRKDYYVVGFNIDDTKFTIQMPEQQYEDELTHCDVVDEQDEIIKGEIVKILGTRPANSPIDRI